MTYSVAWLLLLLLVVVVVVVVVVIAFIQRYSPLSSRVTAFACDSAFK